MENDDLIKKLPARDIAKLFNLPSAKREAALAEMIARMQNGDQEPEIKEASFATGASQVRGIAKKPRRKPATQPRELPSVMPMPVTRRKMEAISDAESDANRNVFSPTPIAWGNNWVLPPGLITFSS